MRRSRSGRWRFPGRAARCPFAVGVLAGSVGLMTLTTIAPRAQPILVDRFGFGWADLTHGRWWRLATACLVSPRAGLVWSNLIVPGVVLVLVERRWGTARSLVGFFVGDWSSTVSTLIGLRLLGALGSPTALADAVSRDVGSSSGTATLAAALAVSLTDRRHRQAAVAVLFGWLTVELLVYRRVSDVQHLGAASVGLLLGRRWTSLPTPADPAAAGSGVSAP